MSMHVCSIQWFLSLKSKQTKNHFQTEQFNRKFMLAQHAFRCDAITIYRKENVWKLRQLAVCLKPITSCNQKKKRNVHETQRKNAHEKLINSVQCVQIIALFSYGNDFHSIHKYIFVCIVKPRFISSTMKIVSKLKLIKYWILSLAFRSNVKWVMRTVTGTTIWINKDSFELFINSVHE